MCGMKENTGGTACVWVAGMEHYSGFRTQGSECVSVMCGVGGGVGWGVLSGLRNQKDETQEYPKVGI